MALLRDPVFGTRECEYGEQQLFRIDNPVLSNSSFCIIGSLVDVIPLASFSATADNLDCQINLVGITTNIRRKVVSLNVQQIRFPNRSGK